MAASISTSLTILMLIHDAYQLVQCDDITGASTQTDREEVYSHLQCNEPWTHSNHRCEVRSCPSLYATTPCHRHIPCHLCFRPLFTLPCRHTELDVFVTLSPLIKHFSLSSHRICRAIPRPQSFVRLHIHGTHYVRVQSR